MTWPRHLSGMHRALTSTLGETVRLRDHTSPGTEVDVRGIYARPPVGGDVGAVDLVTPLHTVNLRASDAPAWLQCGTLVDVRGITLEVERREPDGQGMVELFCAQVAE